MSAKKEWQLELDEYIRQGEPDQVKKSQLWKTAIGLQKVDGLETSEYLLYTAKDHIEGKINIDEVQKRIHGYYEQRTSRTEAKNETKEADIVSARIAELLGKNTFQFSPTEFINIHRHLFQDVFSHAGQIRKYDITKKEWVLNGASVTYAPCYGIRDMLGYDFATEKQFLYEGLSITDSIKHLAQFAADIWQIHPFCEGNTRTTAVFMIKYLQTFGFNITNDVFEKKSWYFRNALVRANYNNMQRGVYATTKYLEMFLSNLLIGTNHELKNRYLHIEYVETDADQSANCEAPKRQIGALGDAFGALECTLEEFAVLELIDKCPSIKQSEIVTKTGISRRSIQRIVASLQTKQYIRRVNGKRFGEWKILVKLPNTHLQNTDAV